VVHHLERHTSFDECVVPAVRRVFQVASAAVAASEPCRLLRVYETDASQRALLPQIALVRGAPRVDRFDWAQPPRIVDAPGELGEPRTQPVCDPVERPEANLRWVLDRILPAVRLLEADAEDPDDRPVAHRRAKLLTALSIRPRRHQAVARLV